MGRDTPGVPLVDPAAFYTGIVAELYAPLRSATPDPEPYARFVARSGEPALELGCGDGDPLLELRARGLDVEGLDSSAEMLARCRAAASARGLDVVLHHATMQDMDLGRRYRSVYLAGPTFNLLVDDTDAAAALARLARHLAPDGTALVPLFRPDPTPPDRLGSMREHVAPDGSTMRVGAVAEARDDAARTQTTTLRYEHETPTGVRADERPWVIHWHTRRGFERLATAAGLRVVAVLDPGGRPAEGDPSESVFVLTPAPTATS